MSKVFAYDNITGMSIEIIQSISDAEAQAQVYLDEAKTQVQKIEAQNNTEMEKLRTAAQEGLNKEIKQLQAEGLKSTPKKQEGKTVAVEKARLDATKKYIVEQFNKRYM